ncbi:hypothetical protein Tco_0627549 [Tanacetum coccineum]|uniref:Uncharacterized protein n=1 Tax=Tanacetum coccineum TaxID=301880 RepID=A0ABQ4WMT7_9ASTR
MGRGGGDERRGTSDNASSLSLCGSASLRRCSSPMLHIREQRHCSILRARCTHPERLLILVTPQPNAVSIREVFTRGIGVERLVSSFTGSGAGGVAQYWAEWIIANGEVDLCMGGLIRHLLWICELEEQWVIEGGTCLVSEVQLCVLTLISGTVGGGVVWFWDTDFAGDHT